MYSRNPYLAQRKANPQNMETLEDNKLTGDYCAYQTPEKPGSVESGLSMSQSMHPNPNDSDEWGMY